MIRYYLFVFEDGHKLPVGRPGGYDTEEEAQKEALKHVDDALPYNTVHVMADLGHAYLGGDGGDYYEDSLRKEK